MSDTSHNQASESESKRDTAPRGSRTGSIVLAVGLAIVSMLCVALAVGDAIWGLPIARGSKPESGGSRAPLLLATAAAIAILPRIRKFKFGDLEFEAMQQTVDVLKSEVNFLANDASRSALSGGLEDIVQVRHELRAEAGVPIQPRAPRVPAAGQQGLPTLREARDQYLQDHEDEGWDSDPNKDQYGGKPAAEGREVVVRAVPVAGPKSSICKIRIQVRAQAGFPKLTGSVRLYLHPTFGRFAVQDLEVDPSGTASDEITASGAFTIGVIADNGKTRLEYDLKKAPGATRAFKSA